MEFLRQFFGSCIMKMLFYLISIVFCRGQRHIGCFKCFLVYHEVVVMLRSNNIAINKSIWPSCIYNFIILTSDNIMMSYTLSQSVCFTINRYGISLSRIIIFYYVTRAGGAIEGVSARSTIIVTFPRRR